MIGAGLTVCHEENNLYDPFVMAVYDEHGLGNERIYVGYIPTELSKKTQNQGHPSQMGEMKKQNPSLLYFKAKLKEGGAGNTPICY